MKLEDQVCSLELAMRLKELGVKQQSLFYFLRRKESDRYSISYLSQSFRDDNNELSEIYSAFSVAELGEILPSGCHTYRADSDNEWYVPPFIPINNWNEAYPCKTEANARAKTLIYLIENKFMN